MATAAWDLIVVADAKDYLNIGSSDTNQDAWLQEIISDLSAEAELYCKRKFAVQSVADEIYDGLSWRVSEDRRRISTVYFPVTQLSTQATPSDAQKLAAVQYRNDPDSSWTDIETDVDHIFFNPRWDYIELYDEAFPYGVQNIRLSYKAGYSTVPQDLKIVCLEMTAMMWKESNRSSQGILGMSTTTDSYQGGAATKTFRDMKPLWAKTLNRYRIRTV